YLIRSALDTNAVLDVCGASSANGANIQLYGENDGNNQIWRVQEYSSGLMTLYCVGSGKVMSVGANAPKNGQNVQQWVGYQGHPFKWYAEPSGSMSINGATVPTYRLHYLTSQGFVLDAAGGKSTPKTNIQVYANNGSRAQLWAFQPFSILANNLPVPEKFGISVKQGTSITDHEITANGVAS
ncbi:RICIN domain-containing protein, partial [Bilifractor sp. LCP19S3_H10]|uniref:RICIN domain-containing protein n=1 Tax=Bilifractor sp. LCP19S3_H10 TaxID=3438736 RepID=UPI003F927D74